MDLHGIDLSAMTQSYLSPLYSELIAKGIPADFFNQAPMTFLSPQHVLDESETSWLSEIKNMFFEVWNKPTTQMISISIVVAGVVVCSWRVSQYWYLDDSDLTTKSQKCYPNLERSRMLSSTSVQIEQAVSHVGSCQAIANSQRTDENLHRSPYDNHDHEKVHSRLSKVIWRVNEIVGDLKDLETQRKTLQEEISRQQEACLKLQELGDMESSKRQAAEDKIKMIETENHQLKQLNQIITKKAHLIDKLECIIQEKNAIEKSDALPRTSLTPKRDNVPSLQGHLFENPDVKEQLSDSSLTLKGDNSSSVIVLSENDPESLQTKASLKMLSLSPTTRPPLVTPGNIPSSAKSLTHSKSPTRSHFAIRQSRSDSNSNLLGLGNSPRRSVYPLRFISYNLTPIKDKNSGDMNSDQGDKVLIRNVEGRRSIKVNNFHNAQDVAVGKFLYKFETPISPPKYSRQSRESSTAVTEPDEKLGQDQEHGVLCEQVSYDKLLKESDDRQKVHSNEKETAAHSLPRKGADINSNELSKKQRSICCEDINSAQNTGACSDTYGARDEPLNLAKKESSNIKSDKMSFSCAIEYAEQMIEPIQSQCGEETMCAEPPVTEHEPVLPGIINVFRRKKITQSKKPDQPKKDTFPVVKFINNVSKHAESSEKESLSCDDSINDEAWVVLVDCEKSL